MTQAPVLEKQADPIKIILAEVKDELAKSSNLRKLPVYNKEPAEVIGEVVIEFSTDTFKNVNLDKRATVEAAYVEVLSYLFQEDQLLETFAKVLPEHLTLHSVTANTNPSKLFLSKNGMDSLVNNKKFQEFYQPVTKADVLFNGVLGKLFDNIDLHTDRYRLPEWQLATSNLLVSDFNQYRVSPINIVEKLKTIEHTVKVYRLK